MFDRKIISKTYKFMYVDERGNDKVYFFANKAPKGLNCNAGYFYSNCYRHNIYDFFYKGHHMHFLPRNQPANEANITKAMVAKLKFDISKQRKDLTERKNDLANYIANKDNDNVWAIKSCERSIDNIQQYLDELKRTLKIWKARYQVLKDQGVYTYLELTK